MSKNERNIEETFSFWMPAEISKADKDGKRWIQGVASTDNVDLQGEKVNQRGIDLDYFITSGYFNDNHKDGPAFKVGEPTEARITDKGLWVKGFLYKGKESADKIWEHLNSLEQSGSKRRMGFSIQGKVKRREGNVIAKCWLQEIAVTTCPVNTKTWAEIAKSLSSQEWDVSKSGCNSCEDPSCDGDCESKAMTTASAGALIPESLDGKAHSQVYKSFSEIPDGTELSYDDCVMTLQLDKGYSKATAQAVVDCIFIEKGLR